MARWGKNFVTNKKKSFEILIFHFQIWISNFSSCFPFYFNFTNFTFFFIFYFLLFFYSLKFKVEWFSWYHNKIKFISLIMRKLFTFHIWIENPMKLGNFDPFSPLSIQFQFQWWFMTFNPTFLFLPANPIFKWNLFFCILKAQDSTNLHEYISFSIFHFKKNIWE